MLHLTHTVETTMGMSTVALLYGSVALVSGLYGLIAARSWDFFKSYFG